MPHPTAPPGRGDRMWLLVLAVGVSWGLGCGPPTAAERAQERIRRLPIVEEVVPFKDRGFGNLKFETNGEAVVARALIDPGDVVLDVGAHLGRWSLLVLEQDPGVQVHAFEPTPATFVEPEKKLTERGGVPVNLALSDREGRMQFHVYPDQASELNVDPDASDRIRRHLSRRGDHAS